MEELREWDEASIAATEDNNIVVLTGKKNIRHDRAKEQQNLDLTHYHSCPLFGVIPG
jgi:hypothetical protein